VDQDDISWIDQFSRPCAVAIPNRRHVISFGQAEGTAIAGFTVDEVM